MDNRAKLLKVLSFIFLLIGIFSIINYVRALNNNKPFVVDDVTIVETANDVIGNIRSNVDNEINTEVEFHKVEDYVDYKLTIRNNTDENLTIKSIVDNSNDQNVLFQYEKHQNEVIEPDHTFDLMVKSIYKNEQTNINNRKYTNNVKFIINYLDNKEEVTNPKTNDNIQIHLAILIVSIIGFIGCIIAYGKLTNAKSLKQTMAWLLVLLLFPIIAKAASASCEILLSTNTKLLDKVLVTYDIDGNETTSVIAYNNVITNLEDPIKDGYNFLGWEYEDGSSFDNSIPLTDDVKLIAKFERKHATLVFNINTDDTNATGSMQNQTVYYNEETNINANAFVRPGYVFNGWNTQQNGTGTHYDNNALITLTIEGDYNLYAEWIESRANLLSGEAINEIFNELDPDMTEFKKSNTKPDLDLVNYKIISTDESNYPVYAWNIDGIIYWWSEADRVVMNSDCSYMFYGMAELTNVDFTSLDSSEVTIMDFMFQYCTGLVTMDLRLDTSNVTSMDAMFANCTNLQSIDFSHIDTGKVENFHGLVAGCTKLTSINLERFNVESATSFESMFSTLPNLTEIDLSDFNTPNLESTYFMFLRCTNLTTIYASEGFSIDKITDGRGTFSHNNKLVGGAGTAYSSATVNNINYIRIDDPDNGKPGYLTPINSRYIRYDGNGATGGDAITSHYLSSTNPGKLKTNTYINTGLTFTGWNTQPDGSGVSYTDEQLMDTLESSKTPLTLYAIWE